MKLYISLFAKYKSLTSWHRIWNCHRIWWESLKNVWDLWKRKRNKQQSFVVLKSWECLWFFSQTILFLLALFGLNKSDLALGLKYIVDDFHHGKCPFLSWNMTIFNISLCNNDNTFFLCSIILINIDVSMWISSLHTYIYVKLFSLSVLVLGDP